MKYDALKRSEYYHNEKVIGIRQKNRKRAEKSQSCLKEDIRQAEAHGLSYGEYILRKKKGAV